MALIAVTLAACTAVSACGGSAAGRSPGSGPSTGLTVAPAADATNVRPDAKVTVNGAGAALSHVDVTDAKGTFLSGTFGADHTTWTSEGPLAADAQYRVVVSAVATNGHPITRTSMFHTAALPGTERLIAEAVTPADGASVGIAQPLIVAFNHQVRNRKAVTDALQVDTFPHVDGAWYWIDAATVDFRPEHFWPAGTAVTFHANLLGVDSGGLWGGANRTSSFTVPRSQIINVNVKAHQMQVVRDGIVVGTFDISSGKPGWETRNGIKVISEKITDKTWYSSAIDAPDYYVKHSQWAMRMTDSGEFIHDAPWNSRHMGEDNASHGCVGLYTDDMDWLFSHTILGDAVVVTGSPVPFTELSNRIQDWNIPWDKWLKGNLDLGNRS